MCEGGETTSSESYAPSVKVKVATDEPRKWPEDMDGNVGCLRRLYRRWLYSYMNVVLAKGRKQTNLDDGTRLTQEDLFPVPQSIESKLLSQKFRCCYELSRNSKSRLIVTLLRMVVPTLLPAGFCQLVTVIMQVSMPLLVRQMLLVLEQHPFQPVVRQGLPYAIGIFLTMFINSLASHRHRHLAMKSGIAFRASIVNVLYEHALRLTPRGRTGLESAQLANLVAVDAQKLYEVAQELHLIWSLPLSIILTTVFLVLIVGPSALCGIVVLIILVPIVGKWSAKMLSIRQKRVTRTDIRVGIVTSMLQGIKVTKLNNYEESYESRVLAARKEELGYLRQELAVWAATFSFVKISPVIATAATFVIYVLAGNNVLTAATGFSVLLLFTALRFPVNYAGRLVGRATQAFAAAQRISGFLDREARQENPKHDGSIDKVADSSRAPLIVSRASFLVGSDATDESSDDSLGRSDHSGALIVSEFNFSVNKGEVIAVCGPVGSGKSSLINGIIDEIQVASSETVVATKGKVAFVPQTPFILNATLRDNILFGQPFDQQLYDRVLDACCLRPDLEQLGMSKDLTEIGERGVTLSGGQKQRVSLARAAYSCPDLVLLDDPLSALDAGTAKQVFERLIKSERAFFSDAAVVLVTHASHFLNRVDRTILIVDGTNKFMGSWKELLEFVPQEAKTKSALDYIKSSVQDGAPTTVALVSSETDANFESGSPLTHTLMAVEDREHGLSSLSTWLLWFRHAGGIPFVAMTVFLLALDRIFYIGLDYWLARWTEGADSSIVVFGKSFPPQDQGRSAQYGYLTVYIVLVLISLIATIARSEWCVLGGAKAATVVFTTMLSRVVRAPVSYFETTPLGRIITRFTYDIEVIEVTLTQNISVFMIATSWYVAGVTLMIVILPYMALIIFPITAVYWLLLLHYRKSGADLQRLDAASRSPIQAMISEGIDGSSTIRVFQQESAFLNKFREVVDLNSSALLNFVTAQRWLGVRIELLGSIVVLVSSVLVVCLNQTLRLQPGIVGVLIVWSSNFTIALAFLVDTFGEAEAAITAIERVDAMSKLPQERSFKTDDKHALPPSWPTSGLLEFDDVCLRYRDGLPLALDRLSFRIPPGKSCGVVGRTGAGKSSLTVALFRLIEIESGRISLDGVDLATIGLSDVRGRPHGMAIIPQDPFLAGGTLRECLDPFSNSSDQEILEALKAVRLSRAGSDDERTQLTSRVQEGGSNFSVGERQLLNLARALLSKPKVLVLDEATASIDGETDAFIQKMLRTRFADTTLVTVAHRLNTIMDYDLILVMEAGRAVEFGSPSELLDLQGPFAELVEATGPESAQALRALAVAPSTIKPLT